MNNFGKFVVRNWRFLQTTANYCQTPTTTRVHRVWKKPCQILVQIDSGNSYGNGKSSGNKNSNYLLPAGGVFLSLFKWGEEEEDDPIPELIMMIKRSIWLIQVKFTKNPKKYNPICDFHSQFLFPCRKKITKKPNKCCTSL